MTDAYYGGVMLETLKVAAIATVLCLIVGYPVAYFMVRFAGRWNGIKCIVHPGRRRDEPPV